MCEALKELFADDLRESREQGIIEGRCDITCNSYSCAQRLAWDGGKWLEVYLGCSYNDFFTICFIIGGNYSWKHTIKENIYKACKDGVVAFVYGVSAAFTLSICF